MIKGMFRMVSALALLCIPIGIAFAIGQINPALGVFSFFVMVFCS
jgi:hypothetical protein